MKLYTVRFEVEAEVEAVDGNEACNLIEELFRIEELPGEITKAIVVSSYATPLRSDNTPPDPEEEEG